MRRVCILLLMAACAEDAPPPLPASEVAPIAKRFTEALCRRDYAAAYAMTSASFRARHEQASLQTNFERIVPRDFGPIGPIEVVRTLDRWPKKEPGDAGWVYVSIGGDVYSEAVQVVVTRNGTIRGIEYGRP